jgi:hypothetical protein
VACIFGIEGAKPGFDENIRINRLEGLVLHCGRVGMVRTARGFPALTTRRGMAVFWLSSMSAYRKTGFFAFHLPVGWVIIRTFESRSQGFLI